MQSVLRLLYPHQCVSCGALVENEHGLCAHCWGETPFASGLVCDACGIPLIGEEETEVHCDECLARARPWTRGRAALLYRDNARRLVLALKHGDRLDLVRPAAKWMVTAGQPVLADDALIVPIPAHRSRLLIRKYNQAAALAQEIARLIGRDYIPDALIRVRKTPVQDGLSHDERYRNLASAISAHRTRGARLKDRYVVLIDDVMTSGATFTAATDACLNAGAARVGILALARVPRDA